jgi:hypothetical protein
MRLVDHYMQMHSAPLRLRACELCAHGCTTLGQRCDLPEFKHEPSRDPQALRAFGGACGPDAKHLAMPGVTTN